MWWLYCSFSCFNSKLVRLEVPVLGAVGVLVHRFNSKLVRLEGVADLPQGLALRRFNSKLVRLEAVRFAYKIGF